MRVLKFGGTSVGSPAGRQNICDFALSEPQDERVVVVVSALGGVTDMLLWLCREAAAGNRAECAQRHQDITNRHLDAIRKSIRKDKQEMLWAKCLLLLGMLWKTTEEIANKMKCEAADEARVVSFGEQLSSLIMADMIEGAGHLNSLSVVKTLPYFTRNIVDFVTTNRLLKEHFEAHNERIVVMGGFISSDTTSAEITNLGRGGSDYTAAVVAAALGAQELYIYTDVDGFLSCDPRIVPEAQLLDELSFTEAMELCNFGAKVLYAPTLFPAYNAEIPIIIRSTLNKECAGTTIAKNTTLSTDYKPAKGISSINDSALLTLRGKGSTRLIGINYRIFRSLCSAGVHIYMVSESKRANSTSVAIKNGDVARSLEILTTEFAGEIERGEIALPEAKRNLATLAVVGSELADNKELSGQIYDTLKQAGIPIIASRKGATAQNIAFVSELWALRDATKLLHRKLFTKIYETLTLYINGSGSVAQELRALIRRKRKKIARHFGLNILVVERYEALREVGCENGIYVECEKSATVDYKSLNNSGVSIVTALIDTALSGDAKFLYGATVADGLCVLGTLKKLRASGDQIESIEAYLGDDNQQVMAQMTLIARECGCGEVSFSSVGKGSANGKLIAHLDIDSSVCEMHYEQIAAGGMYSEEGVVVLINSKKYRELPLQIRSYGGYSAEVISRALLRDIMQVAEIEY